MERIRHLSGLTQKLLISFILVSLVSVPVTLARSESGFSIYSGVKSLQTPVEQQTVGGSSQPNRALWVVNPTRNWEEPCVWDADDQITIQAYGDRIAFGETATVSICIIGDWTPHLIGISRNSSYLDVTLSLDGIVSFPMVSDTACILGPDYDHDAAELGILTPIAGSNGGVGKIHFASFIVENKKPKGFLKNANVLLTVTWSGSGFQNAYCPHGFPVSTFGHSGGSYPLRWWWDF